MPSGTRGWRQALERKSGGSHGAASLAVGETFQNPQSAVLARLAAFGKGSHEGWGWPEMVAWRTLLKRVPTSAPPPGREGQMRTLPLLPHPRGQKRVGSILLCHNASLGSYLSIQTLSLPLTGWGRFAPSPDPAPHF